MNCKKALSGLSPYVGGRPVDEIKRIYGLSKVYKLASNENPYGFSSLAKKAATEAAEHANIYPDGYCYDLRIKLADIHKIKPDMIAFGTGSDGLIELICKTFIENGDEAIMAAPSFSLYYTNVAANGGIPVCVPVKSDFSTDLIGMKKAITAKTKLIWLCNPNNPTGSAFCESQQREFIDGICDDCIIVIDEAYIDFADKDFPDSLKLLKENKNVIILRTFSKIYGLAALRVGYAMTRLENVREMEKVRAPFNVNSIAQAAAAASLDDEEFRKMTIEKNNENKQYMYGELKKMGLDYIPSSTNFIAVKVGNGKKIYEKLLEKGYIVKGGHVLSMNEYIRVTVGTSSECRGFIKALQEVQKDG